jgi:hypothetical protein
MPCIRYYEYITLYYYIIISHQDLIIDLIIFLSFHAPERAASSGHGTSADAISIEQKSGVNQMVSLMKSKFFCNSMLGVNLLSYMHMEAQQLPCNFSDTTGYNEVGLQIAIFLSSSKASAFRADKCS